MFFIKVTKRLIQKRPHMSKGRYIVKIVSLWKRPSRGCTSFASLESSTCHRSCWNSSTLPSLNCLEKKYFSKQSISWTLDKTCGTHNTIIHNLFITHTYFHFNLHISYLYVHNCLYYILCFCFFEHYQLYIFYYFYYLWPVLLLSFCCTV